MAEFLVGDAFVKEYNELFEKVNGVGSSLTSRSGNDVPARVKTVRVKIDSIIISPSPAYDDSSSIQFKATEIDTNGNTRKWDIAGSAGEASGVFVIKKPLYGTSLEFDFADPAASNDKYVDSEFDVEPYSFKDATGTMVRGWRVIASGSSEAMEFGLCTITAEGDNDNEFIVDVRVGNPNLTPTGDAPKGVLYLNYATTDPVAIGAQIFTALYASTKTPTPITEPPQDPLPDVFKYDCIPIETLFNLITPPEPEPEP